MRIIGLYSPVPQSGKSTVTDHLLENCSEAVIMRRDEMAAALKSMLVVLLLDLGVPKSSVKEYLWGASKNEIIPGLGVSGRRLMVTLGTDWGRNTISEDLWVDTWRNRLRGWKELNSTNLVLIADDVRFGNEAEAIREEGGELWKITRPDAADSEDVCEGRLDNLRFDATIVNDGTTEQLRSCVDKALKAGGMYICSHERIDKGEDIDGN